MTFAFNSFLSKQREGLSFKTSKIRPEEANLVLKQPPTASIWQLFGPGWGAAFLQNHYRDEYRRGGTGELFSDLFHIFLTFGLLRFLDKTGPAQSKTNSILKPNTLKNPMSCKVLGLQVLPRRPQSHESSQTGQDTPRQAMKSSKKLHHSPGQDQTARDRPRTAQHGTKTTQAGSHFNTREAECE